MSDSADALARRGLAAAERCKVVDTSGDGKALPPDDGNTRIYPNGPELLQPADVYLRLVRISRLKRAMQPLGE